MKLIKHPNGDTFLIRFTKKLKKGSIKLHIIWNDDIGSHTHPWDFKSLIIFGGYIERTWKFYGVNPFKIEENEVDIAEVMTSKTYGFLSVNKKQMNQKHQVILRRFLSVRIPAITIGFYGEKKQLCSLCKELGYCKTEREKQLKNV